MIDDATAPENVGSHDAVAEPTDSAGAVDDAAPDVTTRVERELAGLDELPLADHADAYARIHTTLDRELAEIDGS